MESCTNGNQNKLGKTRINERVHNQNELNFSFKFLSFHISKKISNVVLEQTVSTPVYVHIFSQHFPDYWHFLNLILQIVQMYVEIYKAVL